MPVSCYFSLCLVCVVCVRPSYRGGYIETGCKVFVLAEVSIKKQAQLSTTIRDTYLKAKAKAKVFF